MIEDIKKDAVQRMARSVVALQDVFRKLRTGRAHTGLLENVSVAYYDSKVPLSQTATIAVEDARTLTVAPWDKQMIKAVEKAILTSDLGLTPVTAGTVIRVPLPPMTEQRRKDLVKIVRHETEAGRISVRSIRRDGLTDVKELLKDKLITEDEDHHVHDEIQKLTDSAIAEMDQLLKQKESEIMEF